MRLISAFEVPPDADATFISAWEQARELLSQREGAALPALHRALRSDAEFRFVNVARVESPKAWRQAIGDTELPGGTMRFKAHSGLYEVLHEDGIPEASGRGHPHQPVRSARGRRGALPSRWDHARELLATQRGYLGTRLHRSLAAASFRFINIARWSSPLMFSKAVAAARVPDRGPGDDVRSHPALYQVICD